MRSLLDRSRTVAPAGYNRWLVPPAALAIHLAIGEAYAFSVFNVPLEQVVAFYNRGGDFREWGHNGAVRPLKLTNDEQMALVAFLKSLTDDRVRFDRAPFDHPQLGRIEIGGWNFVFAWSNAPLDLLRSEVTGHADFAIQAGFAGQTAARDESGRAQRKTDVARGDDSNRA